MPRTTGRKSSGKKAGGAQPRGETLTGSQLNPLRAGMPAQDSILGVVAPQASLLTGKASRYRIIQTNERDEYEEEASAPPEMAMAAKALPTGDSFKGEQRKAAKLSLATAKIEKFDDLKDLIGSLTPDSQMTAHVPPIGKGKNSDRVVEEQRNIRVKAFLYAASREGDNDFHLIIGRAPGEFPEMYMTMELSGLPPPSSPSHGKLKTAREAFKKFYKEFLKQALPGLNYGFPDPPVEVVIQGSLFFDVTHSTGKKPGPKSLKSRMPTIWEVHPISRITFKP